MQATSIRTGKFQQTVRIGEHTIISDEPGDLGGDNEGPTPQELLAASLASCTAITMLMYAERKGWDIGKTEVSCSYTAAERGAPTRFQMTVRFPPDLDDEAVDRLMVIATKCPVHRVLEGEVMFEERVERVAAAG